MPTAGVLPVNDFAIWSEVIPGASGQTGNSCILATEVNATNYTSLRFNGSFFFAKGIGGVSYQLFANYNTLKDTPFQYQAFQSRVYGMGIRVKQQGGNWSAWALKNDADGRLDVPVGTTYQIGARSNVSHFAGYYPGLLIAAHADPKAYLESLTTKYGV